MPGSSLQSKRCSSALRSADGLGGGVRVTSGEGVPQVVRW